EASGARLLGGTLVRGVARDGQIMRVQAEAGGRAVEHSGRIVIGADGASSVVSRSIGNNLKDGVLGLSVRTTYAGIDCDAGIRVYFNRDLFPSYGWMFIDEHGTACVGLGCAVDPKFPPADNLGPALRQFIAADLKDTLAGARRIGPFSGGIAPHFRPEAMTADGVILIGDAACQADPLNRGGIHTAIESAFYAADACRAALHTGDFSRAALARYEALWGVHSEPDWRTSEIFMSLAKNPGLKDLALFLLQQVGTLGEADPRFGAFASGVFSGALSQSSWLSVRAFYDAAPKDPAAWAALLRQNSKSGSSLSGGSIRFLARALASVGGACAGLARRPAASLHWGLEIATKTLAFADRRLSGPKAMAHLGK
ncbi:MAG: NAD(P)/FAD-dependent oxidoreductase, partial [Caulobacteraceae bacterium]